jgi:hypothetical protein
MDRSRDRSQQLERAKRALLERLANEPGFVGIGVAAGDEDRDEIVVFIEVADAPVAARVPNELDEIPVRTQVVGAPRRQ